MTFFKSRSIDAYERLNQTLLDSLTTLEELSFSARCVVLDHTSDHSGPIAKDDLVIASDILYLQWRVRHHLLLLRLEIEDHDFQLFTLLSALIYAGKLSKARELYSTYSSSLKSRYQQPPDVNPLDKQMRFWHLLLQAMLDGKENYSSICIDEIDGCYSYEAPRPLAITQHLQTLKRAIVDKIAHNNLPNMP